MNIIFIISVVEPKSAFVTPHMLSVVMLLIKAINSLMELQQNTLSYKADA